MHFADDCRVLGEVRRMASVLGLGDGDLAKTESNNVPAGTLSLTALIPAVNSRRIAAVDVARGCAMCAVVAIHVVGQARGLMGWNPELVIGLLSSWALPLFALASGYVEGGRSSSRPIGDTVLARLQRLMVPYFAWELVYYAVHPGGYGNLPSYLFAVAVNPHAEGRMWFLYIFFVAQVAFVLAKRVSSRASFLLCIAGIVLVLPLPGAFGQLKWLLACLVVGHSFAQSEWLREQAWRLRFVSPVLAIGLFATSWPYPDRTRRMIALLGGRVVLSQAIWVMVFTSCALALVLPAFAALLKWMTGRRLQTILKYLGCHSTGIYVTHFLVVDLMNPRTAWAVPLLWLVAMGFGVGADWVLSRTRLTSALLLGGRSGRTGV